MKDKSNPGKAGYPRYPDKEDIYRNADNVSLEESKNLSQRTSNQKIQGASRPENQLGESEAEKKENKRIFTDRQDDDWNEANFDQNHTGDDLDVPGSEADDAQEAIGEEDEENNYYSLGGDRHDA